MCKLFRFLYRIFPITAIRNRIILAHFEKCQKCLDEYGETSEIPADTVPPIALTIDLIPGILRRIQSGKREEDVSMHFFPVLSWKWLYTLGIILVLSTGVFFLRFQSIAPMVQVTSIESQNSTAFVLESAQIDGEKAKAYVFHPNDSRLVIVWFQKS